MTPLEQAKRLDTLLTMYKNRTVMYSDVREVYPSIDNVWSIPNFLVHEGLIENDTNNRMLNASPYKLTGKGQLHLDAGGYTAQIEHKEKMDSFVIMSAQVNEKSLRVSEHVRWISIASLVISLLAFIVSFYSAVSNTSLWKHLNKLLWGFVISPLVSITLNKYLAKVLSTLI